jgi:protein-disulfide isomerase
MSSKTRLPIIVTLVAIAIVGLAVVSFLLIRNAQTPSADGGAASASALAPDTHVLDDAGDAVVLVEFLDLECPACGAFYPYVQQLREEFAGEVTFAFRYFPLPSHGNAVNAALAVESAHRQGQLEPMFDRIFSTQSEWGESAESQAALFRQYAAELGLDLDQYDRDVADPTTLARIESDFEAGRLLGVNSTPSFFLNDERLELSSFEALRAAIEEALASR